MSKTLTTFGKQKHKKYKIIQMFLPVTEMSRPSQTGHGFFEVLPQISDVFHST